MHLSHVELKNMGQQREKGRYPVNFHRCGDVDQRGGYNNPAYVDSLSIHHSFSRCVAIHATNGLLVSEKYTGLKQKKTKLVYIFAYTNILIKILILINNFFVNLSLIFYFRLGTQLATIRWDIVFSWRMGLNKGMYFSITWAC